MTYLPAWIVGVDVILGILVLFLVRRRNAKPLSRARFAEYVAKAVKSAAPGAQVAIRSEYELGIKDANGEESTLFLDNAYASYLLSPRDLSTIIQPYVETIAQMPARGTPIERSRIVPIVKDRTWPEQTREALRQRGSKTVNEWVFDSLNEELIVVYAGDLSKGIQYLNPESLREVGVEPGELRALAVENLRRLLPKIEVRAGPLVSIVTAGGDYEASLLLFDDLWSGGHFKVDGEIVVAIPSREVLLVTGSRNAEGIARVRELAAECINKSPYRLTSELFVYRDGSFKLLGKQ